LCGKWSKTAERINWERRVHRGEHERRERRQLDREDQLWRRLK
jgi:hypothetical protein